MKRTVGFIGLGTMGKPMARNLMKAGFPLVVHNRSRAAVNELVAEGAAEAWSPKEVAERAEVVITCLPDSSDVELVALGAQGLIGGARPGLIYIDMSTISPLVARKVAAALAEKGVKMLDAPVSGGDVGAKAGTLAIMVGGKREVFESCLEIFQAMGQNIVHVGGNGAGQIVKACNQIVVAATLEAVGEALVLGARAGVDPAKIVEAISGGAARCWALEVRAPRLIKGIFTPGFKSRLHYKDLNIIMQASRDFQVPLPVSAVVHQLFNALLAAGRGELDHSAIITVLEDLAGCQARTVGE